MHNWRLRHAQPTDATALARCVDAAYRHYIPRIGKPPGPMLADYAEAIACHQVWVAEAGRQIIGGLILIPEDDYLSLDNIAVHPDHQGRGVGRALLDLADAEALSQGYRELRLYTHETMTENIDLYTRRGWVETHRGQQAGYARVFMHKRLPSPDCIAEDGAPSCIMGLQALLAKKVRLASRRWPHTQIWERRNLSREKAFSGEISFT